MNEYQVATTKVLPFLRDQLKWPEALVSRYGRVPVQMGTATRWADFVCYVSQGRALEPWLLVEVKQPGVALEDALAQAESYGLIIGAPYLCVTDGCDYRFYLTGSSQGKSFSLEGLPPAPARQHLTPPMQTIWFPPQVDLLLDRFFEGLETEPGFIEDTTWHHEAAARLHDQVFARLGVLKPAELKDTIGSSLMMKPPNKNEIFRQIDEDLPKIRKTLEFIRDFGGDPVWNLDRLLDRSGDLYVRGGGIFFVTQLLAGAHPNEYVVLEENISRSLLSLEVVDILVRNDTANGYIYVNDICRRLYEEKMKPRLEKYGFGLPAVHNFLWHYYVHYRIKKHWGYAK